METSSKKSKKAYKVLAVSLPLAFIISLSGWLLSGNRQVDETAPQPVQEAQEELIEIVEENKRAERVPLPEEVRGIYWTASSAGSSKADALIAYMKEYGLNTAVIDLKMDNGALAYLPQKESLKRYMMENPAIKDFPALLEHLKDEGIYRVARIAVMRDTVFASQHPNHAMQTANGNLWRDNTGAGWIDPASDLVDVYAKDLAREAYEMGFDEIQFDYVRFASDGALSAIRYTRYDSIRPKYEVMRDFFDDMGTLRDEDITISFDVFGMTYWSTHDFNIGQRLEDVYPNADFISPMVYPSHYPPNFQGFANPAVHPYEIVKRSLDKGVEILETDKFIPPEESRKKTRPWLQDFDIGAVYTAARIEAQIKAARDAGASGWILWNARNVYEPANYR